MIFQIPSYVAITGGRLNGASKTVFHYFYILSPILFKLRGLPFLKFAQMQWFEF